MGAGTAIIVAHAVVTYYVLLRYQLEPHGTDTDTDIDIRDAPIV